MQSTATAFAARRRLALAGAGKSDRVSALLVSHPQNVSYLSGFEGEDSWLLIHRSGATLITDGRFGQQAKRQCPGIDVLVRKGPMAAAAAQPMQGRGRGALGVEGDHLTLRARQALAATMPSRRLVTLPDVVGELRARKDARELAAIQRAIRIAQEAMRWLLAQGRAFMVGKTERRIAAELDYRMRLAGADRPAFETIVAAGSHAALPHYRPRDVTIKPDMPVLIDWGACAGGYCSDLTRMVVAGRIPPKLAAVYELVLRAQKAGIAAIRAGRGAAVPDAAAREVLTAAGYGPMVLHGLGHGIGREVHERPSLGSRVRGRLRAGMVVTAEPGVYLPGVLGVRIEDDVLVTPTGARRLSSLPRDLAAMTLR